MYFKRDKELIEKVEQIAEGLPSKQKETIQSLIKDYENATFSRCDEKRDFDFEAINTAINDFSFEEKEIAEELASNHNTLQQTFMRLCYYFIKFMSDKPYCNERNEASVNFAKQVIEAVGKECYFPHI